MRVRQWVLLVSVIVSLGWQGCHSFGATPRSLTAARRAAVEGGARQFMAVVARDVTQEGPMAWRKHFAKSPEFFMAVNGKLAFPNGQTAAQAIPTIASQFKHIELSWGNDLRLDALTENLCVVAASYTEVNEMRPGFEAMQGTERGYFTGLAENRDGQWQFRDAHWSMPVLPEKVP